MTTGLLLRALHPAWVMTLVIARFFLRRDYTPRYGACISDLLESDISEHDVYDVEYGNELSLLRHYHHEQCGEARIIRESHPV